MRCRIAIYLRCDTLCLSWRPKMKIVSCTALFSMAAFILTYSSLANTQAPNDSDPDCLDHERTYASYETPLMDTSNYGQLLLYQGDTTRWQKVDADHDNMQWLTTSEPCSNVNYVYGCDVMTLQSNWLITQHISTALENRANIPTVRVKLETTPGDSCPSCGVDLSLYVWRTSNIDIKAATDADRYHFVGNITSEIRDAVINLPSLEHTGFYLGIRDNGSCVNVDRVLVYYTVCESSSFGLVRIDEMIFNSDTVQGTCVDNSVSVNNGEPLLRCTETGEWVVVTDCQCSDGFVLDHTGQECLELSLGPLSLTVDNVTNTTLTLSWLPPDMTIINSTTADLYYTVMYDGFIKDITTNATVLNVVELTPYSRYIFSITTENEMLYQEIDVNYRTSYMTVTTEEGVGGKVTDIIYDSKLNQISWSVPVPSQGDILRYFIVGENIGNLNFSVQDTIIGSELLEIMFNNSGTWSIMIQAVTRIGGGEFSEPFVFILNTDSNTTDDRSSTFNLSIELLIGIIAAIVILVILIIATLFIILLRHKSHKKKLSTGEINPTTELINDIEDYASIKLSPTDPNFIGITAPPPVPRSPRPMNPGQNGCVPDTGPIYHVLDGTALHTMECNQYSLDPVKGEMFGDVTIDQMATAGGGATCTAQFGDTTKPSGATGGGATGGGATGGGATGGGATGGGATGGGPIYHELENPQHSSLMKRRVNLSSQPESNIDGGEYWNEGLGPIKKINTSSQPQVIRIQRVAATNSLATGTTSGPEPVYFEVSTAI